MELAVPEKPFPCGGTCPRCSGCMEVYYTFSRKAGQFTQNAVCSACGLKTLPGNHQPSRTFSCNICDRRSDALDYYFHEESYYCEHCRDMLTDDDLTGSILPEASRYDAEFIREAVRDLLRRQIHWPRAEKLSAEKFAARSLGVIRSWTRCPHDTINTRVGLAVWRKLRNDSAPAA